MSEENQDRERKAGKVYANDEDKGTSPDVEAHRKVDDEPEVEEPDVEAHRHQGRGRHNDR